MIVALNFLGEVELLGLLKLLCLTDYYLVLLICRLYFTVRCYNSIRFINYKLSSFYLLLFRQLSP